jgi:hypothetical protein
MSVWGINAVFKIFIRVNSVKYLLAVILIPIGLFALDFTVSPILIDTSIETTAARLDDLFKKDVVLLGTFRGHHVFVSVDDIADPNFLAHIKKGTNALIVSAFVERSAAGEVGIPGALVEAVRSKLQRASQEDYLRLRNLPETLRGVKEGRVIDISVRRSREFPIDSLLVMTLPYSHKAAESLRDGLKRAFAMATDKSVSNIIIPSLGIKWKNSKGQTDTPLSVYFDTVFGSMPSPSISLCDGLLTRGIGV